MKELLEDEPILDVKKALTTKSICKVEKKGFHETENWFPPNRMKDLFQKHVYISQENKTNSGRNVWKRK